MPRPLLALVALVGLAACGAEDDRSVSGPADDPAPTEGTAAEQPSGGPSGDPTDATAPTDGPADTTAADPMDGGTVDPPLTVRDDLPDDSEPVRTTPSTLPAPSIEVGVPPPGGVVEQARADLASRLAVPIEEVLVVSAEEVTWPDGSLGCPRPGMAYTQALVNGSRVVLEVDGATYEYHSGGGAPPFHCADPTDPAPPGAGGGDI